MKKKLYFITVIAMGTCLVACGGTNPQPKPKQHSVSCTSSEMRLKDATAYEGLDYSTTVEVNSALNEEAILPSSLTNVTMSGDPFTNYSYTRNVDKKTAKFTIKGEYIKGDIVINDDISHLYTVTWNLDNGDEKIEETYEAGVMPEFKGTTPIKEDSEITDNYYQNGYVFNGWKDDHNQDVHLVDGDVEYKAQYKEKSIVTRLVLANSSLENKTVKINYTGTCEGVSWDTGKSLDKNILADFIEHPYESLTDDYTVISIFGHVTSITLSEKVSGDFKPLDTGNLATRCIILGSYINTINQYAFAKLNLLNTVYLPVSLTKVENDIAASCDLTGKSLMFYAESTSMPTTWDKNWAAVTTSHVQNYEAYYSVHTVGVDVANSYTYVSVTYNGYEELAITGRYRAMPATGELTIPNTEDVNGIEMPVTAIMYEAFKDNTELKQITIPDTIDCIGKNAFKGCTHLGDIYLTGGGSPNWPSKLEVIEESAFESCRELAMDCDFSVDSPLLTTIGENAFRSSHIKSLKLGKRVNSIGNLAFCQAGLLETVDLSLATNLTVISDSAFQSTNLKSFKFPPKVREIKDNAFNGSITTQFEGSAFVLPKTLTKIGSDAFNGLPSGVALDATAYENAESIPDGLYNMLGSSGGYNNTIYIYDVNLKEEFLKKAWPQRATYIEKPTF